MRPQTMAEQIAASITLAILNDEYGPGDRILELDLAEQFHVSRGPIREALRILEKSGVVTILPQRGAHVTNLSVHEVKNLFDVRCELMPLLIREIAPPDPAWLDQLEQKVVEMEHLAQEPDAWDSYTRTNMRASQFLFAACRNEKLAEILKSLSLQTARYTQLGLRETDRRRKSALGWRHVHDALRRNQIDLAADMLKKLISDSSVAAQKALQTKSKIYEVGKFHEVKK